MSDVQIEKAYSDLSYHRVKDGETVYIPEGQQMIVVGPMKTEAGAVVVIPADAMLVTMR